jgi:hypothetical protein
MSIRSQSPRKRNGWSSSPTIGRWRTPSWTMAKRGRWPCRGLQAREQAPSLPLGGHQPYPDCLLCFFLCFPVLSSITRWRSIEFEPVRTWEPMPCASSKPLLDFDLHLDLVRSTKSTPLRPDREMDPCHTSQYMLYWHTNQSSPGGVRHSYYPSVLTSSSSTSSPVPPLEMVAEGGCLPHSSPRHHGLG